MTAAGTIAGLAPTMMGVALAGDNMKTINSKKPMKTKDMINMGVKNIVGVSMIGPTAALASLV